MTTPTQAARVRSLVDHPIIDADGHFVELGPLLQDEVISYVEDAGGCALREGFPASGRPLDTSSRLADPGAPRGVRKGQATATGWGGAAAGARAPGTPPPPGI